MKFWKKLLRFGAAESPTEDLMPEPSKPSVLSAPPEVFQPSPPVASTTNVTGPAAPSARTPTLQDEFDSLWVSADSTHRSAVRRGEAEIADGRMFIKRYIFERLATKHKLEPEDFAKLEGNFLDNWSPGIRGWEPRTPR